MTSRKRHEPSDSSTSRKHTQKKTRFVSPEDDPVKFSENVEEALEDHPSTTKRGRVKTEGYDSDSTDDGEGVVPSRRPGEGGADDDDEDMFAAEPKEDGGAEAGSAKKKEEKYLRLGDIEGQEFGDDRDSGDEALSEESEDEPIDEDEAERRRKAGMGYELSSFNMREEMEEGKFTDNGMYVRSFDPHAVHDKWMDGTDEREMKKARRAQRAQRRLEKERLKQEAGGPNGKPSKQEMEMEIVSMLKKGESVLEALARLGAKAKKSKDKEKSQPSPQASKIDRLTALASDLMSSGDIDIYDKTYEQLLRSIRSTGDVEPDWVPPSVKYEYKWDVPEAQATAGDQVFGPFGGDELRTWYDAKYFGDAGEKVKVRVVGGDWGDWDSIVDE
ncbi:hypothetical protein SCHPADRAFT_834634 [Schizopora paradoxa]|uniref:GYF domain-containing protein n=1 Tax=Schizopora paradoxa TaxID=27342 RepID=A0A0H2RHI1_9AGAM|nr:hypothetical protein SCHPADRAFT_834634 [Schizopora paradoxa]